MKGKKEMVHLNIGFGVEEWRGLRDLATERRSGGRTSMARIIRELVAAALAKRKASQHA